jgi:hypothetical protein
MGQSSLQRHWNEGIYMKAILIIGLLLTADLAFAAVDLRTGIACGRAGSPTVFNVEYWIPQDNLPPNSNPGVDGHVQFEVDRPVYLTKFLDLQSILSLIPRIEIKSKIELYNA